VDSRIPRYVALENGVLKFFNRLGLRAGPVQVLTVVGRKSGVPRSTPVTPWTVDGRRYLVAGLRDSDWARNARAAREGVLAAGRRRTPVRLTEVTDAALKQRVVLAFGTENRFGAAFLNRLGAAPDRSPAGLAAAVPNVAVFKVTPVSGAAAA
jgi:deazaflavin-dependent oxidoreductase (nitroreductase family)